MSAGEQIRKWHGPHAPGVEGTGAPCLAELVGGALGIVVVATGRIHAPLEIPGAVQLIVADSCEIFAVCVAQGLHRSPSLLVIDTHVVR